MLKTILVVDDDPAVLQSYGRLLRRLGHRVVLSEDSEQVRSDPESLRDVDLLILDQRMPHTSGLALLACLRQRCGPCPPRAGDRAASMPAVILISAYLSDELRDLAQRLGVVEVIEKPVDAGRLRASVRAALERPAVPIPLS